MHGSVYIADALTDHSLNRGLVERFKFLPDQQRGVMFRGLRRKADGIITGATRSGTRPGGYGALSFNGSSNYVDFGAGSVFDITSQLTLSAWVRGNANNATIMSKWTTGAGTNNSYLLYYSIGTGLISFSLQQSDTTVRSLNSSVVDLSAKWNHIVAVADGAVMQIYRDGKLVSGTTAYDGTIYASAQTFQVGAFAAGSLFYWAGLIDDACIYNRGLSPSEVAQIYEEQLRGSPETLKWYKRKAYSFADVAGGFQAAWARNCNTLIGAGRA